MDASQGKLRIQSSDEDLAGQASSGCLKSFEELVRRYQVPLMRFLLSRGCRSRDAEDLVQETFLNAYRALDRFNRSRSFKTWIFTIGYRLAISEHRKHRSFPRPVESDDLADTQEGPLPRLERQESRKRLWDLARNVLSEPQFTAVWLYYSESLSAGEIARVMDRSWPWVKTALHRSRRKLQAELTPKARVVLAV